MIYEGKPFICSHAVSLDYKRKLRSLCDEMIKISTRQLMDTYRSGTIIKGQNIDYQKQLIYNLKDRFSNNFNEKGYDYARRMIFSQYKNSSSQMSSFIDRLNNDGESNKKDGALLSMLGIAFLASAYVVPEAAKASLMENEALISSIPSIYYEKLSGIIARGANTEAKLAQLKKEIQLLNNRTRSRAENIALDQSRKAFQALSLHWMRETGIKRFKWVHNYAGNEPRIFHKNPYPKGLNGGIFEINNPPIIEPKTGIRGFPGQLPYCQCTMAPII